MRRPELAAIRGLARQAGAEFRKIAAARMTLAFLLALPVGTYLFAFELYRIESAGDRLNVRVPDFVHAVPVLFFASWKTLLFQAALVSFAAFWTTLDSQYGMIRVACAQPVSRTTYLVGKWLGIGGHVVILSAVYVLCHGLWGAVYSGLGGMGVVQWTALARFAIEVLAFSLALAWVAMAAASFRRTVGSGIVIAVMAVVVLALMTMLPFDLVPPRLVFMRYFFFPLGELPNPWPGEHDSPFVRVRTLPEFWAIVPTTPLLLSVAALLHFRRRDITE
jgi:ABC-type transport system involved in multi-copper enzyme maturation permease subunit